MLSPEVHVLLTCAKVVLGTSDAGELRADLSACPSVEELCKAAIKHRMLGQLHKVLTESPALAVDQVLVQRLDKLQRTAVVRSLNQTGHLIRVLDVFEGSDIEAVPFKGPVWAEVLYGDSTLRSSVDIDLLVDSGQAVAARQALLDDGFVDLDPFNAKVLAGRLRLAGQIALQKPRSDLFLDLHWRVNVAQGRRSLEFSSVRLRSAAVKLLGREVLCPGRADMLLITCLAGTRERWDTVGRLLDLSVQVQRMPLEEWTELLHVAELHGCRRRVLVSVDHVCRTLGVRLPAPPGDFIRGDCASRILTRALSSRLLDDGPTDKSWKRTAYFIWSLATEDRIVDFFLQVLARMLLPTSEEWRVVSLPRWLEWLYYPLRPMRLVVKWLKRAFLPRPSHGKKGK